MLGLWHARGGHFNGVDSGSGRRKAYGLHEILFPYCLPYERSKDVPVVIWDYINKYMPYFCNN
jgi:hypothetical protein